MCVSKIEVHVSPGMEFGKCNRIAGPSSKLLVYKMYRCTFDLSSCYLYLFFLVILRGAFHSEVSISSLEAKLLGSFIYLLD